MPYSTQTNVSAQTQVFGIRSRLQPSQGPQRTWSDRVYASPSHDDPASQVSKRPNESSYLQFMQQQLQYDSKEGKVELLSGSLEGQREPAGHSSACLTMQFCIKSVLPFMLINMCLQWHWCNSPSNCCCSEWQITWPLELMLAASTRSTHPNYFPLDCVCLAIISVTITTTYPKY